VGERMGDVNSDEKYFLIPELPLKLAKWKE
jgi:hypothetical protein